MRIDSRIMPVAQMPLSPTASGVIPLAFSASASVKNWSHVVGGVRLLAVKTVLLYQRTFGPMDVQRDAVVVHSARGILGAHDVQNALWNCVVQPLAA